MKEFTSSIAAQIEGFLQYKEAHGHKRSSYAGELSHFDRFCSENHTNMVGLTKTCVLGWAIIRDGETKAGFSRRMSVVRQLGEYMALTFLPAYVLPPKFATGKSDFVPYLFTDRELSALFYAADHISASRQNPFRSTVVPNMLRLIYTCGLRPGEGRLLKNSSVNLQTGEILIEGTKTHKQRSVVMSDDMLTLCRTYNRKRGLLFPNSIYFFPDPQGQPYSSQWLLKMLKACWRNANPTLSAQQIPNVRVYDLRHRFATAVLHRWTSEGQNIVAMLPYLRTYMGHEHFNETLYYIHLLPENLALTMKDDSLAEIIPGVEE